MIDEYDNNTKYNNILNIMQKNFSFVEVFLFTIKYCFTNNCFYYFLCVVFRFTPLLLISNKYIDLFDIYNNDNSKIFKKVLDTLTLYNIINYFHFTYNVYIIFNLLIYFLFSFRVILYFNIIRNINKCKKLYKWPIPSKCRIIIDHIQFLLFPYIIEYLSFAFYIYFYSDKFIIKVNKEDQFFLIIVMIINAILIIFYNIINYIFLICTNKIYTTSIFDAFSKNREKNITNKKNITYRCSNFILYIFIFLQNFSLIMQMDNYINNPLYKIIYKIIFIIIILSIVFVFFFSRIHEYKYSNFINYLINIIILFCFSSIIFDFITKIAKCRINTTLIEIIYIFTKIFFSYIIYYLYIIVTNNYLKLKIANILFQKTDSQKDRILINSFYYLNEIMIKIKENNDIIFTNILIEILNSHINNCNKIACNCKLIENVLKDKKLDIKNKEKLKAFISELLIILNYLYESVFIEYDYFHKYELAIILSEHFCHLKDNPTIAFSIINNLIQKQREKLTKNEKINLYELSQKYLYYISAEIKKKIDLQVYYDKKELLIKTQRTNHFKSYFNNLKISCKLKKFSFYYIDNLIKILKYKNIFEDSLIFQFDEGNENIISIKIDFLNKKSIIENYNKNDNHNLIKDNKSNLYNIINLLKKEKKYYQNFLSSIDQFEVKEDIPIFIIFKLYLFYDILEGGKIPDKIAHKLLSLLAKRIKLYNNYITKDEYILLTDMYYKQNNINDSKYFSIFEFKKDLIIKYFNEECSLKLGYKQKDICNKPIDILFPKEFCESHKNIIKEKIIGNQLKYFLNNIFLFNSNSFIFYPIKLEALLIYNLSKYLTIICEFIFIIDQEYKFMLNNNFELLANSQNFEDEYYLNQKMFKIYKIKITDILKIKPEKLFKKFQSIHKRINSYNKIRKIKIEEYLIPKLYVPSDQKIIGNINNNYLNREKYKILTQILNSNNGDENIFEDESDEKTKLINREKLKNLINDLLINPIQTICHETYNITLNKKMFIENIIKELSKILEDQIFYQNDYYNNKIITGKHLMEKLLTISELSNDSIRINIKLSYYYNKQFYFITIIDEKKIYLKLLKKVNSISKKTHLYNCSTSHSSINNDNHLVKINERKKNRSPRKNLIISIIDSSKTDKINKKDLKEINNNKIDSSEYGIDKEYEKNKDNDVINKIDNNRKIINNAIFILIIRIILSIIIIFIIIIYLYIIYLKSNIINISEKIIMSNHYNFKTRDIMLNIYSRLLQIYYEINNISIDRVNNLKEQQEIISTFSKTIKENYHNFEEFYFSYNLDLKHDFKEIYDIRKFNSIIGFWEESEYNSMYTTELDIIIYNIYSINLLTDNNDIIYDSFNFLFFNREKKYTQKIKTYFIKLLFYICVNYELAYKKIFNDIHKEIEASYKIYINYNRMLYLILEFIGLFLYIIFFISANIYLYNANQVIIKNILFLFLDFSEEEYNKDKIINNNNLIIRKLLELKNIIDDFNLNNFKVYKLNIEKINKNQITFLYKAVNEDIDIDYRDNCNIENNNYGNNDINKSVPNKIIFNKGETNSNKSNNYSFQSKKELLFKQKSLKNDNNSNKGNNNSSLNYLIKSSSSQVFKDKLNSNSLEASNKYLTTNNDNINKINKNHSFKISKYNKLKNNKNENNEEGKGNINFHSIILSKSNSSSVILIKIFKIILFILFLLIMIFSTLKIITTFNFIQKLRSHFYDFTIIINRFSLLHYYFNIFRALIVINDEPVRTKIEYSMDNITLNYEEENNKYFNILSYEINNYIEAKNLFKIITNSTMNSTGIINRTICENEKECINYLNSKYNVFDSGIDFGYKSSMSEISNLYMDYKKLNNKNDIEEIKSKIINYNQFNSISLGISNFIIYVKRKIFTTFQSDLLIFKISFNSILTILNFVSIIISIITMFFVNIFVFITISRFSRPIKESSYRINCSFYNIKKYSPMNN